MSDYMSFGSAMDVAAKSRELAEGQKQASDKAGNAVHEAKTNIRGQREAAIQVSAAKLEMAKANIKKRMAESDISFKTIRLAVTAVAGGISAIKAHHDDRGTDIERARAVVTNQRVARERLRGDGEHARELREQLDFNGGRGRFEDEARMARGELARFDEQHQGSLTGDQAQQRRGITRRIEDAEQRAGEMAVFANVALMPDPMTMNIPGQRDGDGSFNVNVESYLEQQGLNASQRAQVGDEARERLQTRLQEIRQDRETLSQGQVAGEMVEAHDEVDAAKIEQMEAKQELQAAHQSGDRSRIQQAERRLETANERVDTAERRYDRAHDAFRKDNTEDVSFWKSSLGKAMQPFLQDMFTQLLGDGRGGQQGGLVAAAAAYAQAVQAMSNAAKAAGDAAEEAAKLGVDIE